MATQKFLQGGYVGKLGATVGQRWKNIRTVRAYAIPHNPRTPLQQSNREKFAQAIKLAQLAMIFNKGAEYWKSDSRTEFQLRTSQAKKDVDRGAVGFSAVPIIPSGTTPQFVLSDMAYSIFHEEVSINSSWLAILSEDRHFIVALTLKNISTGNYDLSFYDVVYDSTEYVLFSFEMPSGYTVGEDSVIMGVTIDDKDFSGSTIYLPAQPLREMEEELIADISYRNEGETLILESYDFSSLSFEGSLVARWTYLGKDSATGEDVERIVMYNLTQGNPVIGRIEIAPSDEWSGVKLFRCEVLGYNTHLRLEVDPVMVEGWWL